MLVQFGAPNTKNELWVNQEGSTKDRIDYKVDSRIHMLEEQDEDAI